MRRPVCHLWGEEEYFHQLDRELIDSMRRRAAFREERQRLEHASQVHEPATLDALEKVGYDHNTVTLLFLAPLVQVAWGDGFISQAEREQILAIARIRGVKMDTPADKWLTEWLDRQPPKEFFERSLRAINAVLLSLAPAERKAFKEALLVCCRDAAESPSHFSRWKRRVPAAKRQVIEEIEARLAPELEVPA